MCHEDSQVAVDRGLEGFQFFAYALSHYYLTGTHTPGVTDLWAAFQTNRPARREPSGGIGTPAQIRATMEKFEETGVDQVVFIQQAGNNRHAHICTSLELFAGEVMPGFKERHEARARRKAEKLAPSIERALSRIPTLPSVAPAQPVEAYPVLTQRAAGQPSPAGSHEIVSALIGTPDERRA
jgi:hypothetical protein